MTMGRSWIAAAVALVSGAAVSAGPAVKTQAFLKNQTGFSAFAEQIVSQHGRNLLARKGVQVFCKRGPRNLDALVDGDAGVYAGDGRVNIDGAPTVITYYLGGLKPIHHVGLYTCNGDSRANQRYDVYLADNSARPGKMPAFGETPTLTTGEKILGQDGGPFFSHFAVPDADKAPMGKADWIQFRIWRTYPSRAGAAYGTSGPSGWCAAIELEVLGDPKDVRVEPPEVKRRREMLKALIRNAPKQPPHEKKATWQETLVAARESLLRWECELDRATAEALGIGLGPWHTLGALSADDPAVAQVQRLKTVDLGKPLTLAGKGKGAAGRTLRWRPCPQLADGQMVDVAAAVGAKEGESVVLCRALSLSLGFRKGGSFGFGVGTTGGAFSVVGGRSAVKVGLPSRAVPNQVTWAIGEGPGDYHVLAVLPAGEGGRCRLWFVPQPTTTRPGAGDERKRVDRRRRLLEPVAKDFPDPASGRQIQWERADCIWNRVVKGQMARRDYRLCDWAPGEEPLHLVAQYNAYAGLRADAAAEEIAVAPAGLRRRVAAWLEGFRAADPPKSVAAARKRYYAVATVQEALAEAHRIESMRLAVEDQQRTFGEKYPRGGEYLRRIAALEKQMAGAISAVLAGRDDALARVGALGEKAVAEGRAILLDNPLLKFEALLLGRGGPGFSSNWGGANRIGNEIVALSPVRPDGEFRTIHKANGIHDMDLSFDGKKILYSAGRHLHEVNVDGTGYRQITKQTDEHVQHYDACRLPSGKIVFVSTACEQAVPCTGGWHVGNLHVIDADGTNERRLTYDQDHDWNPCVLSNGQVVYTRWEYTDTPHYFSRLLFSMNPDGTAQMEYYGSNSYWPNAMYWPTPIPGHPTRVVCIVSGHHGVSRVGQMVILDTAKGRQEADGVVHRIGDRGKTVEPVIKDGLVKDWWPRFAHPYPLAEPGTHRGAGKYFLANCMMDESSPWSVVLVDVFDNITVLLPSGYGSPIPLRPRPTPPVIPERVDPRRTDALVYMSEVHRGGGLRGYPRGTVQALRIGSHVYRYGGNGDTRASSFEGGWDVKRIHGTVPVEADGSAYFRVPANTPVFIQPLDAEGKSLQVMRSWFTAMPGEVLSCVGCHERQSDTPGVVQTIASARPPSEIKPWFGPARGFSFDREVQPVLDRRCVGCHDGQKKVSGTFFGKRFLTPFSERMPDFRAKRLHEGYAGNYSPAYLALAPYVRRAGYEADYHLPAPSEWQADTSPVVQLLKKGHHNVRLTGEEWRRLFAWIDFNVPYAGNWRESHRPPDEDQVARRIKYKKLYANLDDRDEAPIPPAAVERFVPPQPADPRPARVKMDGWPLKPNEAAELQEKLGVEDLTLDLGEGVSMTLVPVPAGRFVLGDANGPPDEWIERVAGVDRPFYLGKLEVTNRQYARFDPSHDSAYMDARGKDRFTRGYPVNEPEQPVIRVSWHEATVFCRWLSARTGRECTLPTEVEWEWACRAGTATPWSFGADPQAVRNVANVADTTLRGWAWGRAEDRYSDGARFSVPGGRYPANTWGLCDMHGNVAEWTASDYGPASAGETLKVVRGGSWFDRFRECRSASRWRYPPHQPVFNVGFRVLCRPAKLAKR